MKFMKAEDNKGNRNYYVIELTKYIKGFVMYLISSVFVKLIFKVLPLVLNFMTSYYVSKKIFDSSHNYTRLVMMIFLVVLLNVIFAALDIYFSHDMAYKILTILRNKVYEKIDEVFPAGVSDKQSGDMISTIIHDIEFFEWFYAHIALEWCVLTIISSIILIVMGTFSIALPLVICPFMIFIVVIPVLSSKKADSQGGDVRVKAGKLNATIVDGVQGIKEITSNKLQEMFMAKLILNIDEHNNSEIAYTKRSANEKRIIFSLVEIGTLFTIITATLLVINGNIDSVWLLPIFTLSYGIFSPLKDAIGLSTNYGFVYGAAKRVFDLLQLEPKVIDSGKLSLEDITNSNNSYDIEFKNVCFKYSDDKDESYILENTSFKINTGESVVLVSKSGGGKTTIARLIQRFYEVDEGSILINGVNIKRLPLNILRQIVSVVSQDIYLFNDTIANNLKLANSTADGDDLINACQMANIHEFIEGLPEKYDTFIGERGFGLSGGERQRISVAQVLLKNSPIIIFDEASSNLDYINEKLLNESINTLKRGRLTLIIAHRLSTIRSADRVLFLNNGRIEACGTYDELLKNANFNSLVCSGNF